MPEENTRIPWIAFLFYMFAAGLILSTRPRRWREQPLLAQRVGERNHVFTSLPVSVHFIFCAVPKQRSRGWLEPKLGSAIVFSCDHLLSLVRLETQILQLSILVLDGINTDGINGASSSVLSGSSRLRHIT